MAQSANDRQVGGNHYGRGKGKTQHWDMVWEFDLDYFQAQVTRYLFRWREKNGLEDLEKARHYLDKYIELAQAEEGSAEAAGPGYVNQDRELDKVDGGSLAFGEAAYEVFVNGKILD